MARGSSRDSQMPRIISEGRFASDGEAMVMFVLWGDDVRCGMKLCIGLFYGFWQFRKYVVIHMYLTE